MEQDPVLQNRQEAATFEKDFTDAFAQAQDASALDFASQFDVPQKENIAAEEVPQKSENRGFSFDDLGRGVVARGEAELDQSLGGGRDVALGVMHSPRSVARGVRNGLDNMLGYMNELHKFNTDLFLDRDPTVEEFHLPEISPNETKTVTGSLIEGVAQFLTGLKGVDKVGKAIPVVTKMAGKAPKLLKSSVKGGFADVFAFDKHDDRLANVAAQLPGKAGEFFDKYLAADPDDGAAEAAFKQFIEGFGLGFIGDALFDGVRLYKRGRAAKVEMDAEGSTIDDLFDVPPEDAAGVGVDAKHFEFLGNPEAEDLFVRKQAKLDDATAETASLNNPKTDAIVGDVVDGLSENNLWRLTPDQLDAELSLAKLSDDQKLVKALGEEGAKTFKKLERSSNSQFPDQADAAQKELDQFLGDLAPEQERLIYGVGESGAVAEDFKQLIEAHSFSAFSADDPLEYVASSTARAMVGVDPQKVLQVPVNGGSLKEQAAFIRITKGVAELRSRGVEKDQIAKTIADGWVKSGYASSSDAAEIVGNFVKRIDELDPAKALPQKPAAAAPPVIDDYEINFARIDGPDDIKQLMDDMVNNPALKPSIEEARRGKTDHRATLTAATDIDGFDELMNRRTGDAFNAETIVAARKVYYDTTTKLMDAAKRAASPEASDIDQFNFRKMIAVHHAVQKEFMGVRAEAGRALQAWNIPVGGSGGENLRAMEQILNEFGGGGASKDLAQRLVAQGNNLNTTQINAITTKAASARTMDAVTEAWTLGLLTNPTTHVVNLESNVLTQFWLGAERLWQASSKDSPVTFREGGEYFTAILESQKLAIKNAAEAFRTGRTGHGMSKLDLPRTRATARDILDPEGKAGFMSKALDGLGAVLSKYVGGALAAGDEYSKTILYQAQVRSLAVREGTAQGLTGGELKAHVARTLADPPAAIRADATTFANYGTFTKELGKTGQDVQRIIARHPALRFIAPFVRTPANIFKFTFERTPLAPLSQKVRDDLRAGGARKSAAMAKIGMGTSILALGADMSQNGIITGGGPNDPDTRAALRRTGWQPYSIKVGDTWYSYSRFEPLSTPLGMAADLAEILSNYESYDIDAQQEVDNLAVALTIAASNQVVGKTFLSGFADTVEMFSDPGRYGEKYLQKYAGSFVPAGSAALERAVSPEMEEAMTMMDRVKSRLPGFSENVPKRRNVWGEEISYFTPNEKNLVEATVERIGSLFNPVYYSKEQDAPVDRWLLENGFQIRMPQKRQAFDDVRIDLREFPAAYSRLVELRGSDVTLQKYGNQNMKDFFLNLATEEDPFGRHVGFFMAIGNSFDDQQNFINQVVSDYNAAAKDILLDEYPEINDAVYRERSREIKMNDVREPLEQILNDQPEESP